MAVLLDFSCCGCGEPAGNLFFGPKMLRCMNAYSAPPEATGTILPSMDLAAARFQALAISETALKEFLQGIPHIL